MPEGSNVSDIELKTGVSRPQIPLIERPELLARIGALAKTRLLLLIAPPGFGKTILLTQWADSVQSPVIVLSRRVLDESDAKPRSFLMNMAASLHHAGVECLLECDCEQADEDKLLGGINRALAAEKRQVHIVLDDYHRASSPVLDKLLQRLVQTLPVSARIILASRTWPDIGIGKFLASGLAEEISADNLRFSNEHSQRILGSEVSGAGLEALVTQLEGWPIALALTRLALAHKPDSFCAPKHLVSRGTHLSAYFAAELISHLTIEQVDFLLETSILERFDIALADTVRGRADSWKWVDSLEPLYPLISQVEGKANWYRYHRVLAEYLRRLLYERHYARVGGLHSRASRAFAERGIFVEAVLHAASAGDFDRCAQMVSDAGGWKMVLYGKGHELARALHCIPARQYRNYPCMIAADAYLQLRSGNPHAASTALCAQPGVMEQNVDWEKISADDLDVFNVQIFLHGYEDNELTLDFFKWGQAQRQKMPGCNALTQGVLDNTLAVAAISVGRFSEAEAFALGAVRTMGEAGSILAPSHCYLHAGLAALHMGNMRSAAMYLTHAADRVNETSRESCHLKTIIGIVQEHLQLWHWHPPIHMSGCEAMLQHGCEHDGWFDIFASAFDTLFRAAWIYGDAAAMERILRIGEDIANTRSIQRFQLMVKAFALLRLVEYEHHCEARKLALSLMDALPLGVWQQQPHLWRPFQEVGFALFRFFLLENAVINFSLVEDMLRGATRIGHVPCQIRAILARAVLRERNGQRREALADVFEAVEMASSHDLQLPFVEQPELEMLLQVLKRQYRKMNAHNALGELFVSNVLEARRTITRERKVSAIKSLSPREQEVALEIGMGRTNKEIARSLDLTVHTVKFHLRNIFTKIGVERRAHVQSLFNEPEKRRYCP